MRRLWSAGNRLFMLARSAERSTRWWVIPILLLFFQIAGAAGLFFDLESAADAGLWQSTVDTTAYFILSYLPLLAVLLAWIRFRERRAVSSVGLEPRRAPRFILIGGAFGLGLVSLATLLLMTSGNVEINPGESDVRGLVALGPAFVVLIGWIVQGTVEEVMFRGWLLQNSGVQIGPIAGIVFTTVTFAIFHGANPGINVIAIINLVLVGVLFALLALFEGGVWAASAFHIAWNWAQSNLYGFKVSGLEIGGGSLIEVTATGSSSITGGDFGLEGSLAATTVLVIGIFIILGVADRYPRSAGT